MATQLYPYPPSLNQEAVVIVGKAFIGQLTADTFHAAWELAGFAASQFPASERVKMHAMPEPTHEEAQQYLQGLAEGKMLADWGKLFKIAMLVIQMVAEAA